MIVQTKKKFRNVKLSVGFSRSSLAPWLLQLQWSAAARIKWQDFYNNAMRYVAYGSSTEMNYRMLTLPNFKDLEPVQCVKTPNVGVTAMRQTISIHITSIFLLIQWFLTRIV